MTTNKWSMVTGWNNAGGISDLQNSLNSPDGFNQPIQDYTSGGIDNTDNSGGGLTMNDISSPSDNVLTSLQNQWTSLKLKVSNELDGTPDNSNDSLVTTQSGINPNSPPTGAKMPTKKPATGSGTAIVGVIVLVALAATGVLVIKKMKKGK